LAESPRLSAHRAAKPRRLSDPVSFLFVATCFFPTLFLLFALNDFDLRTVTEAVRALGNDALVILQTFCDFSSTVFANADSDFAFFDFVTLRDEYKRFVAFHNQRLYVPISSWEEFSARTLDYPCCTSRGAIAALHATTGRQIWKTYVMDEPKPTRVNANGVSTIYWFQYGTSASYGLQTSSRGVGSGTRDRHVAAHLSGLSAGTT
jgi:hypothetical protein